MKLCCLFSYATAAVAAEHMQFNTIEVLEDADASAYHGKKYPDDYWHGGVCTYLALVQCKNCGTLFCESKREEVLCLDDGTCFFTTYYPINSHDEALSFRLKVCKSVWIEEMKWIGGVKWSWNNPNIE